jgi:hypothetical protein
VNHCRCHPYLRDEIPHVKRSSSNRVDQELWNFEACACNPRMAQDEPIMEQVNNEQSSNPEQLRRSKRTIRKPVCTKDYVV